MSVDETILVNHGKLDKASQDAQEAASFMNTQFSHLKDQVNVLRRDWDGPAQRSYDALQNKWDDAANAMYQVLKDISTMVTELNKGYRTAENKMADEWHTG